MRKMLKRKISTLLASVTLLVMGCGITLLNVSERNVEAYASTLSGFMVEETAAIRKSTPVGIRFTVNLDTNAQDVYEDLENVTCGSILLPQNMLDGELTLETAKIVNIPTTVWRTEGVTYQSVLGGSVDSEGNVTDIPASFYNRPIVARGYITGTKGGNEYTYYTENTAVRSIGYIAAMATDDGDSSELLTKIVNGTTKTLVASNQTLSINGAEGVVLKNAYASELSGLDVAYLEIGGIKSEVEVTYSIDKTNVAAIENGKIVAKSVGNAILTASCEYNGQSYEATSAITVSNDFVGQTDYTILLSANATATETVAANTLKKAFGKLGAEIEIATETGNETTADKYISIGETALAKANVALSVTKATASQVSSIDNTMFIRGVTDNGTLNGVQQWLGDALDYDYYTKDTYSVSAQAVNLPAATSYTPDIEYNMIDRSADVMQDYGLQKYSDGVIQLGGNTHNSTLVLHPDTYYNSYADWYATKTTTVLWWETTELIKDSSGKAAELCYTAHGNSTAYNAMVNTAANKIVDGFKANPTLHRISFSVRDGYYECNCDACEAKGNTSDTLVAFLNDVCAKVETGLAGDARQSTFKVVTLAYHQTNEAPKNIASLANYASFKNHVELWFGDSYGDYTDGLKDSTSSKNQEIYTNFQKWSSLVGETDVLLWVYYTNTKNGFVPYNTFTAIRENYAMAYNAGVDYMFNQTIQGRSGWTMLKHYLISQLAWNATPSDAEWNEWLDAYFENAYGSGATAMRKWFNDWLDDSTSAYATSDSNPAIHKDMVTTSNFPKATMQQWIAYADAALMNLDENDPNYTQYYNNIILEKLSPEYFLIELYGMTADYAEEFVWGVRLWDISYLGENVKIDATLSEISGSIESVTIEDRFLGEVQNDGTYAVTLQNGNIKAGTTYAVTGATVSSVTATTDGELNVSLASGIWPGTVSAVTISSADYTVNFTNVIPVTKILRTAEDINLLNATAAEAHLSGYYVLGNDIDCSNAKYEAGAMNGKQFIGTFDGQGYTISNITVGSCGIFGVISSNAVVKNVNFENVSITTGNNYTALLAGACWNSTIENVTATFSDMKWPYTTMVDGGVTGLLVSRFGNTACTLRNVTLDAGILTITNALGCEIDTTKMTFENVQVLANNVTLIGCTAANSTSGLAAWPTGVTYTDTLIEETEDGLVYVENGNVSLESDKFEVGTVYTVMNGNTSVQTVVTEAGKLTAELTGLTVGATTITCVTEGKAIAFTNVYVATKILKTADDLNVLNAYTASGHITGYYVLGNNIDCAGATYRADGRNGNQQFQGTFDGCGYTISNLKAGSNGIFNLIVGGTVKNVNFTDVSLIRDGSNYTALLAGQSWGATTYENINVTFKMIEWPYNNAFNEYGITGLLVARLSAASTTTFKNTTIDATGLAITNALGCDITGVQFSNVTVKGDSYTLIGCTGANSSSGIAQWPTGVTYIKTQSISVTAPADSDYYTFVGSSGVVEGRDYTFTVTEKVAGLNDFIVLVNGEEVTGNNGTYTVENVTEPLTIKVLHGYIEADETAGVSVQYNGNSIKVTNAVYASDGSSRLHGHAYISAEYIEYMISQGYKYVSFTYQADGVTMFRLCAKYNGTSIGYIATADLKDVEQALVAGSNTDLEFWGMNNSGSGSAIYNQGGYFTITNLQFFKEKVSVTAPAASDYYTFTGAASAIKNGDYTFTVTEKVAGLNDFIVLVNSEEVQGNNGTYTVENVTEDLTIQVLHGYIEADESFNVSVAYSGNTIKVTNSVFAADGNTRLHGNAYISADYIEYMISQGYKYVGFTVQADGAVAAQAVAKYNGNIFVYHVDGTAKYFEQALVQGSNTELEFWGQNARGSGNDIRNQGGYLTITDLVFFKEKVSVTTPAANTYYTFSGASMALKNSDYTFTVAATKTGLNDFIVLVNGEEATGNNGTYTVENVTEDLTIQVLHGYVEYGAVSSATYTGAGIVVKDSTSTSAADYSAYISADYVNYMIAQGYTNVHVYLQPDGSIADQAIVACGNTIVRTPSNYTSVANVTLQADTTIKFWCQQNGSGSTIQSKGGYMTVTGITYVKADGATWNGMPETVAVTAPAESNYYTFAGDAAVIVGTDYTFTVTAKKAECTSFLVFANGEEVTGSNGTYTVQNVTADLTIKVIHGYIEYGSGSFVSYENMITVTDATSTSVEAFMAYISADYVNYLMSQGYNYWDFYIVPDGEIANQAIISCGNTITRTVANGETEIARVQLQADTAIKFWCQKDGSGSAIQGQCGWMSVTYGEPRVNA